MRFGYGLLRNRVFTLSKQGMVAIGLLALPLTMRLEKVASAKSVPTQPASMPDVPKPDPRTVRLSKFFSHLRCPVLGLSEEFISAADENHLDWRLLPSISVIESGGGKAYRNNNIFGWDGGMHFFPSITHGIREVAYRLGHSPLYRNRDVVGKLHIYNPNEEYAANVVTVMNRISPVVHLRLVRQTARRQQTFAYQQN